jgi:hypothetical protein
MQPQYTYPGGEVRYRNFRYAENIGLISETYEFYSSSPLLKEKRLVRYHLN